MLGRKFILTLVIATALIGLFGNMSGLELRAEEPRRAVVSMEMAISGDYIVPHINGEAYYNKPPVFNWIMAGVFKITGSFSEWAVRLPSLLSLLLLSMLHFKFTKKYLGEQKALLSSLFLLTAGDLLFYGSVNSGEIDLFYALITYLQIFAIFHFYQKKHYLQLFLVSYALVGIGFLTKGMPSLAFQALTLLFYFSFKRNWRKLISWQHIAGIGLMILIVGGYFTLYNRSEDAGAFLIRQFKEAAMRSGAETPIFDTLRQLVSFPWQFLLLLLPWSILALVLFKRSSWQKIRTNEYTTFAVVFIVANILLYWISGDFKPRYYYMFFPFALSVLTFIGVGEEEGTDKITKTVKWIFHILFSIAVFATFVGAYIVKFDSTVMYVAFIFFTVLMLALWSVMYFKFHLRWLPFVAVLFLLRIVFNHTYIPQNQAESESLVYRDQVRKLLKLTGDEAVHLSGEAYSFSSDASLGPIKLGETTLTTAPLIAYQIPYYFMSNNKSVMQFQGAEDLESERFYLMPMEQFNKTDLDSLGAIEDLWMKKTYVLVKTPASSN